MDLSVVIPCFNSAKTIETQLKALLEANYSGDWELLIVDNGSTDSTLEIVEEYHSSFPKLRIIKALNKQGSSHARNVGVNHAEGSKILFCDSDDRVGKNWLKAMSEALDHHEFIAGSITLEHINEAWRIPKETPFGTKDKPQKDVFICRLHPSIRLAPSCNMGIRKEVHNSVGGFDESILYTVDTDYCCRLSLAGYQLTFVPDSIVEYRLRHDLRKTYIQHYNWGKGGIWIYRKYVGKGRLIDKLKLIFGGWRHLPSSFLKLRHKSDLFELAAWLGRRIGEVDGCWRFLIFG